MEIRNKSVNVGDKVVFTYFVYDNIHKLQEATVEELHNDYILVSFLETWYTYSEITKSHSVPEYKPMLIKVKEFAKLD